MLAQNFRFPGLAKTLVPLSIVTLIFTTPAAAFATTGYEDLDTAITKVETVSSSLNTIVGGMLTVMVGAAGGSAVFQLFRRMILSNL